jgi:uncharacterized membrane protein YbhN (UPF0104 family)
VRLGLGVLVLGVLLMQIGAGPFVDALRLTSAWALVGAAAITAISTACCAWRWQLVASALGVRMSLGTATAAVYRAQFLNATLPGGVLGDVHRAIGHGRATGAVGRSARSVFWERALGQMVQLAVTGAILLLLPSALRTVGVLVIAVGAAALLLAWLVAHARRRRGIPGIPVRTARVVTDLEAVLATTRTRGAIVLASVAAVVCHLLVFLVAARVAGVDAAPYQVLPIAALVLLAAAVPANVAGWGPREGVAAWAFATAGLGAASGVTTAVVYGVMALAATLPGAVVLLAETRRPAAAVGRTPLPTLQEAVRV